jgi:ABC-type oligopeptide transport system ATPase subunit
MLSAIRKNITIKEALDACGLLKNTALRYKHFLL